MEFKHYLLALRKWWWLLALTTLVAGAASYWSASATPKIYLTTTTLRVGSFLQESNPQSSDFSTSQQLAQSYAQSVKRRAVLEATAAAVKPTRPWESLVEQVNASVVSGTSLLQISVVDADPLTAKNIADEIAHQLILQSPTSEQDQVRNQRMQFVNQQLTSLQRRIEEAEKQVQDLESQLDTQAGARDIKDLQDQIAVLQQRVDGWQNSYANLLNFSTGARTNYLTIVDPAYVPTVPTGTSRAYSLVLASVIGFLLAAGVALLLEYFDDTLRNADEVRSALNLPAIGVIQRMDQPANGKDRIVTLYDPNCPASEAYRVLRTNVQFACMEQVSPVLLVTSAGQGEGKSTTAANLAVSFAQAGKQVVLVDADFRRPALHSLFDVANGTGLTSLFLILPPAHDVAAGDDPARPKRRKSDPLLPLLLARLVDTNVPGLRLLPSGQAPANPADLLESSKMERILKGLSSAADVVIVDSPPVQPFADTAILASKGVDLILVLEAEKTCRRAARAAAEMLTSVGSRVIGVVVNKAPRSRSTRYYHYEYHQGKHSRLTRTLASIKMPDNELNGGIAALRSIDSWMKSRLWFLFPPKSSDFRQDSPPEPEV